MNTTRRHFLLTAAALPTIARARGLNNLKIGVTDWNLRLTGKPEAVALAKKLGFDGVEVSLGRQFEGDRLPLGDPELQARYLAEFKRNDFRPAGTCLDVLHRNYLKNDKLGVKWVSDGIDVTRQLTAKVMLMPFFGKGALTTAEEKAYVADALKDLAPKAEKAGITLGLENTISAEDNVRIMDRVGSKALKVYYDIGNSTNNGFDIAREIEWLGSKRICQFHFKDNPGYLGEGKVRFKEALAAIARLNYSGFANLETDSPSKDVESDMRRNLAFVRRSVTEV